MIIKFKQIMINVLISSPFETGNWRKYLIFRRGGGLTVCALNSGSSCPGSSPCWGIMFFSLGRTLYSHKTGIPANLMWGVTLQAKDQPEVNADLIGSYADFTYLTLLDVHMSFYMIMTDFAIECFDCTNQLEVSKGYERDGDRLITCPRSYDRCMTMKYTLSAGQSGPVHVERRSCSNSASCDPKNLSNSKCNSRNYCHRTRLLIESINTKTLT